jgi:type I restriction enzyme S subunit
VKSDRKSIGGAWQEIAFGDIFEISSSKRVLEAQWKDAGVPFYRAREIVKLAKEGAVRNELFISEELYREYQAKSGAPKVGDLMVSAVGTLGACYAVKPGDRFYYKDASVLRFSPKQPVCLRFIQHAFRTRQILDQVHAGSSSTVGTYTISRANETRIPLPPLSEQKRIAGILDAADALRAKRRESLAQLDSLLQSTFLTLFGDPVSNPMGWPSEQIGNLGRILTGKTPPSSEEDMFGGEIPFATPSDLDHNLEFTNRSLTTAGSRFSKLAREGSTLVCCIGTLGKMARTPRLTAFNQQINAVEWSGTIDDWYGLFVLSFSKGQMVANSSATTLPILNKSGFSKVTIPLPPLPLQRRFAAIVESVERQKARQRAHLADLDALFASLQHRAFRGEL